MYESGANCISCNNEKHPLYVCPIFRAMNHDSKIALLKEKKLCMNSSDDMSDHDHFAQWLLTIEAHALLDNVSFVSERLAQTLRLPRTS